MQERNLARFAKNTLRKTQLVIHDRPFLYLHSDISSQVRFYTITLKKQVGSNYHIRPQSEPMPTKDRFPPRGYSAMDPRIRLAVLIDGSKVSPEEYKSSLAVLLDGPQSKKYVILLHRVFLYEITSGWRNPFSEYGFTPEPFRVESFIPIPMQMGADAHHIMEYRDDNKYTGIAYVCASEEKSHFTRLVILMKGYGVHQLVLDSTKKLEIQTE